MNDNQVQLVDFTTVQKRQAYMLFYIQQPASANSPPVCNASSPYSRPDLSTLPASEATSPMAGDKTEATQIASDRNQLENSEVSDRGSRGYTSSYPRDSRADPGVARGRSAFGRAQRRTDHGFHSRRS